MELSKNRTTSENVLKKTFKVAHVVDIKLALTGLIFNWIILIQNPIPEFRQSSFIS